MEEKMFLNFIGNGSAFNTRLGNNSAYRVFNGEDHGHLFLIDCGGTTFERLMKVGMFDHNEFNHVVDVNVLITHTHPDHIASLGDLIFYCHYTPTINDVNVIVPDGISYEVTQILRLMGIKDEQYNLTLLIGHDDNIVNIGEKKLSIIPIESEHVDNLESYGFYIIDLTTESASGIYYSGDSNNIPDVVMEDLEQGGIDLLYQDTCGADYEGNVHLSLSKLAKLIPQELRGKVACMHLDSKFDVNEAVDLGFNVTQNLIDYLKYTK
jgi:hypothetical protein